MAPKSKRTSVGTKRKYDDDEVSAGSEDIISSSGGSELREYENSDDDSAEEFDEPPSKAKKTNGKSSPAKSKAKSKETPTKKAKTQESPQPKSKSSSKKSKSSKSDDPKPRVKSSNPKALLSYLLSDEALDYANPAPERGYGEVDWSKHTSPSNPKSAPDPLPKPSASSKQKAKAGDTHPSMIPEGYIRYPHSAMTPFQILTSSLLLSKPLSHKLGIRTISTLLNPPFEFGKFSVLHETDEERVRAGLWKARTQHKEKTAVQLLELAQGVRGLNGEGEEDDLGGIRRAIEGLDDVEKAQKRVGDMLSTLKGIGPVGVSIFLRRIQSQWKEVYPYVDQRCLGAARDIGLIGAKEGASEMDRLVGGDSAKMVKLLDTLIGLDLEKKLDDVVERYT
ncbi:hypothetical protein I302_102105 [Kwoniella bestiolae CBS 10118]|uniref:HhH-GPD domain-containing protein n=1 Tax=Kwoniella bestiolae CBS 10118 TaxID=1296100 RepID=A0A1B9GE20_9TREE|nr:hypothetical protein I302_00793 [Kwoniella bestiolae CBS 10118]OCF29293.1 hypothetical protein I302_00793 [Kwoniella bestiolae CBS 10118]